MKSKNRYNKGKRLNVQYEVENLVFMKTVPRERPV